MIKGICSSHYGNGALAMSTSYSKLKVNIEKAPITVICMPLGKISLTTIFGLLPLAMGVSLDIIARDIALGSPIVDWWSNLAVSIVFGLAFSTFITLILTPAVLSLPYALRNDFKKFFKTAN